jgi:hypothetical protein
MQGTTSFSPYGRIRADAHRAAGGDCRYELFEHSEHERTGKPGPHLRGERSTTTNWEAPQI